MASVWLDGRLLPRTEAQVSLFTHTLHYGTGVFDGCRFYQADDGRIGIFRLKDHLARLARGARALFAELPYSPEALAEACREVVRASGLKDGYLRQLVFFGDEATGVAAHNPSRLALLTWEKGPQRGTPVKLRVAGFGHGQGWLPGVKLAGHYARSFLARREAQATGCDDALFLGQDGTIAEATAGTVFAVRDGRLLTPPLSAPILTSITRDCILTLAAEAGLPTEEAPLRRDALLMADEVFLASSAGEVTPVGMFEGRGFSAPGPLTSRMMELYRDGTRGRLPRHRDWLDYV